MPLLDATVTVNERQRGRVIQKLEQDLHTLRDKRIVLLGLSFKPNTDDLRGAPSIEIARALDDLGAKVVGYDPVAGKAAAKLLPALQVLFDPNDAIEGAHAVVVVTEWEEIRDLDPKKAASLMLEPKLVVDGRNALDPASWREAGILYRGFGRG
jgi:UDPglucose 6-dehydrogenase